MKRPANILFALLFFLPALARPQAGFYLSEGRTAVELPFEYINHFIILKMKFNGLPVRFLFDTGAEHTILTKKEVAEILRLQYLHEFHIIGSDMKTELIAYLTRENRIEMPNLIIAPHEDVLVLAEDYFRFEEYAGIEIHGILAGSVFSRYIFKINYQRHVISLYERDVWGSPDKDFYPLDLEYARRKLYLQTQLEVQPDSTLPVKLLLDTGAGLPLLLFTDSTMHLQPPPNARAGNIGMGLGGYLDGYRGRVAKLKLGDFEQRDVVTEFQKPDTTSEDRSYLNGRNGLIGNELFERYQVAFDYGEQKLWLKPTKKTAAAYQYDRSGLTLFVTGMNLSQFTVQNVLPNSPASDADIRPGDRIVRVGWLPASVYSLPGLLKKFSGQPGETVKITVKRAGKRLKKLLILRELF